MILRKNKNLVVFILCFTVFLVQTACKKEEKLVEFDLLTINTDQLFLDNLVDTTVGGQGYYSDTLLISNNFFRSACEQNGISPSDVDSVYLKTATIQLASAQSLAGQAFGDVILGFKGDNSLDTIATMQSFSSNTLASILTTRPKNLKTYFADLASSIPVFFSNNITFADSVGIKYSLSFHVKGYSR